MISSDRYIIHVMKVLTTLPAGKLIYKVSLN